MSWQVNYVLLLAVILCISSACLTFRPFSLSHYDVWKVLNVETFVFQGFLLSSERGTNLCLQKGLTKSSVPHRMPVVPSVQSDRLHDDPLAWEDTWGRVDTRKKIGIIWVDSLTPSMPCQQHYPPSIAVFNFSACLLQDFLQSAVTFPHRKMFLPWSYNYVEHAKKFCMTQASISCYILTGANTCPSRVFLSPSWSSPSSIPSSESFHDIACTTVEQQDASVISSSIRSWGTRWPHI